MKHAYSGTKMNKMDYDPNAGENQRKFTGNSEGGRSEMTYDKVGVADGLGSLETADVKNAETVSQNQRPKGRTESVGEFTVGS